MVGVLLRCPSNALLIQRHAVPAVDDPRTLLVRWRGQRLPFSTLAHDHRHQGLRLRLRLQSRTALVAKAVARVRAFCYAAQFGPRGPVETLLGTFLVSNNT